MGSKTRLSSYCTKLGDNAVSLVTSRKTNARLARPIAKASKRIAMLRSVKFKLDRSSLEKIYFAYIRPILEYAMVVWDSAPRHDY